ncbi:diguanylate cyclase [Sphingomonas jinjuensis]|uniref:diguanylate cyclase n=1 Tax=Sphingomonas jinjuensis TaxID=535907 RepID=A0A840FFL6_9SPHN|nr:diguanylate cyclase [Sphingomonas jinjuensis]
MKAVVELSERTLAFLTTQRLAPTPANYRLAFHCLDGSRAELRHAVDGLCDGGIRLTQAQADELYESFFGSAAAAISTEAFEEGEELRHQALKLADLAASASAATSEFSRELTAHQPAIATADVAALQQIFSITIERANRSERELVATTQEVARLRQQLEAVQGDAQRDALTGLPNRRGIDEHLATLLNESPTVTLAICDIDHFKRYNDRYGHAVGDRVLKTVANSLSESVAPHFVGRWGGEEFIIATSLPVDATAGLVEHAKAQLAQRHFKLRENDEPLGRITFSAGVAKADPANLDATMASADALLYRAKGAGRDCVLAA